MRRAVLLPLLLALASIVPAARAQTTAKPDIVGSLRMTFRGLGLRAPDYEEVLEGAVRFKHWMTDPFGGELYRASGDRLVWQASGQGDECTYTGGPVSLAVDETNDNGILTIDPAGRYSASLGVGKQELAGAVTARCTKLDGSVEVIQASPIFGSALETGPALREPASSAPRFRGTHTNAVPGAIGVTEWVWSLDFEPDSVKLVVDLADYRNWLPEPGFDEYVPGNLLEVTATVLDKNNQPPAVLPESFTFTLQGTSSEPGITLNFPEKAKAKETPDLRFWTLVNELSIAPDSQQAVVGPEVPDGNRGAVKIGAFDGGAFGILLVTARMKDGRVLTGRLEAWGNISEIPLPRRASGSKIGDAYKEAMGSLSLADDDDSDAQPVGDGHEGDGLTHYEEYRGFLNGLAHARTNPRRKTILVRDDLGGSVKRGVALYRQTTGLEVLDDLVPEEMDDTRRVNFNYAQGDHLVDQHGLWIKEMTGEVGEAVGSGPGAPGQTLFIRIAQMVGGDAVYTQGARSIRADLVAAMTAHELLHGSNVWHHGERDLGKRTWTINRGATTGRPAIDTQGRYIVLENNVRVYPQLEDGSHILPAVLQALGANGVPVTRAEAGWVAMPQGQHSGSEDCLMRYDSASWYGRDTGERYESGDELPGLVLCASTAGTGVNEATRAPRSRHGDADPNPSEGPKPRGNCRHQLCVNDRYAH